MTKQTKAALIAEMLAALLEAEKRMSLNPSFNPWDLGPVPSLLQVRAAIAAATK